MVVTKDTVLEKGGVLRHALIIKADGVTIDGNGATLQAKTPGDQGRRHLWIQGGKNLVVRDLTVRGANPNAGAARPASEPARPPSRAS